MRRELRAAFLSPFIFAVLAMLLVAGLYHEELAGSEANMKNVAVLGAGVWLLASLLVFFFGVPYYFWLRKSGSYTTRRLLLGGALAAAVTGAAINLYAGMAPGPVLLGTLAIYAASGLGVAAITWWLGVRNKVQK